jgi:hypothetical protein
MYIFFPVLYIIISNTIPILQYNMSSELISTFGGNTNPLSNALGVIGQKSSSVGNSVLAPLGGLNVILGPMITQLVGLAIILSIIYIALNLIIGFDPLALGLNLSGKADGMVGGYVQDWKDPGSIQFLGRPSQGSSGQGEGMQNRSKVEGVYADIQARREPFMNSREAPYFPDVTNRVLRMENREKEAVRALGKINQERLRRSADESAGSAPVPWDSFWSEWQLTHPAEGMVGSFEDSMRNTSAY